MVIFRHTLMMALLGCILLSAYTVASTATLPQQESKTKSSTSRVALPTFTIQISQEAFFFECLKQGNQKDLKSCWKNFAPKVFRATCHGVPPLLYALEYKRYALFSWLLKKEKIDPSQCSFQGETVLTLLLEHLEDKDDLKIKKCIIELLDHPRSSPLINKGQWSKTYLKEKRGIPRVSFPLLLVAIYNQEGILDQILQEKQLDINQREATYGATALFLMLDKPTMLQKCLKQFGHNIDFTLMNFEGHTLIWEAFIYFRIDAIVLLLKQYNLYGKGLGLNLKNDSSESLWWWIITQAPQEFTPVKQQYFSWLEQMLDLLLQLAKPQVKKAPPAFDYGILFPCKSHVLTWLITYKEEKELLLQLEKFFAYKALKSLINQADGNKMYPLFCALKHNKYSVFKLLLREGAHVNIFYQEKALLLHCVELKRIKYFKELLKQGVSLHKMNQKEAHFFSLCKEKENLNSLLDYYFELRKLGIQLGSNLLEQAAYYNNIELLSLILNRKENETLFTSNAFLLALEQNHIRFLKKLLDHAAYRKVCAESYPLHKIARSNTKKGWHSLMEWLLERGHFALEQVHKEDDTFPLFLAYRQNNMLMLKVIAASLQVDIDQLYKEHTVLYWAVKERNKEAVALLTQEGADVELGAPLGIALKQNQTKIIDMLLAQGASPCCDKKQFPDYPPIFECIRNKNVQVVRLMLEYKVPLVAYKFREKKNGKYEFLRFNALVEAYSLALSSTQGKTKATTEYAIFELLLKYTFHLKIKTKKDIKYHPFTALCSFGNKHLNLIEEIISSKGCPFRLELGNIGTKGLAFALENHQYSTMKVLLKDHDFNPQKRSAFEVTTYIYLNECIGMFYYWDNPRRIISLSLFLLVSFLFVIWSIYKFFTL